MSDRTQRVVACVLMSLVLGAVPAFADGPLSRVHVDAAAGPLRIQDSDTQSTSKVVIIGPKGTRTIATRESGTDQQILNTHTIDTSSDVDVSGVLPQGPRSGDDTGLVVGKTVYMSGRREPIFVPAGSKISTSPGITTVTTVSGGPGSVHSESHTKTTVTPPVRIFVR